MDVEKIYEEKIREKHNFTFSLKEKQIRIIENVLRGTHTVGILPTGYGKSICFQILPLMFEEIYEKKGVALIFSPLKSLMFNQCAAANSHNISSVCLAPRSEMEEGKIEGK